MQFGSYQSSPLYPIYKDESLSSKFSTKLSRDGSVNLLFKAYKDAVAVKDKLQEKLNMCDINKPSVRNLKKIDLVGLGRS